MCARVRATISSLVIARVRCRCPWVLLCATALRRARETGLQHIRPVRRYRFRVGVLPCPRHVHRTRRGPWIAPASAPGCKRYVDAWRLNDPVAIGDLFSPDVRYAFDPFGEAVAGRNAVVEALGWTTPTSPARGRPTTTSWRSTATCSSPTAGTRYLTDEREVGRSRVRQRLRVPVRRADGRCREFTEYYMRRRPEAEPDEPPERRLRAPQRRPERPVGSPSGGTTTRSAPGRTRKSPASSRGRASRPGPAAGGGSDPDGRRSVASRRAGRSGAARTRSTRGGGSAPTSRSAEDPHVEAAVVEPGVRRDRHRRRRCTARSTTVTISARVRTIPSSSSICIRAGR